MLACLWLDIPVDPRDTVRQEGVVPMASGSRFSVLSELWSFMRVRKKWWLGPIVLVLVLFGALIVLTQGSAVAPFIYTIF